MRVIKIKVSSVDQLLSGARTQDSPNYTRAPKRWNGEKSSVPLNSFRHIVCYSSRTRFPLSIFFYRLVFLRDKKHIGTFRFHMHRNIIVVCLFS
jgi:hypothetical protein